MGIFQIHAQCYDRFFEVLPDEVETAELAVEDVMSQTLLALFGEGAVDDVTIRFSSDVRLGLKRCSIQIRAECSFPHFTLFPRTAENIKTAVTQSLSSLLKELFVSVNIDSVMLSPSPWDYGLSPVIEV